MKNKPHPKSPRTTSAPGTLPKAEQPAAVVPPLHALILEKLNGVQHAETLRSDACRMVEGADLVVKHANKAKLDAQAAHTSAIGKFEAAVRDLADVLKGLPDQPVRFAGSLWVYNTAAGLRRYSDAPLVLGGAS